MIVLSVPPLPPEPPTPCQEESVAQPQLLDLGPIDPLTAAQTAYVDGDFRRAVELAVDARATEPVRARRITGAAARRLHDDTKLADEALPFAIRPRARYFGLRLSAQRDEPPQGRYPRRRPRVIPPLPLPRRPKRAQRPGSTRAARPRTLPAQSRVRLDVAGFWPDCPDMEHDVLVIGGGLAGCGRRRGLSTAPAGRYRFWRAQIVSAGRTLTTQIDDAVFDPAASGWGSRGQLPSSWQELGIATYPQYTAGQADLPMARCGRTPARFRGSPHGSSSRFSWR